MRRLRKGLVALYGAQGRRSRGRGPGEARADRGGGLCRWSEGLVVKWEERSGEVTRRSRRSRRLCRFSAEEQREAGEEAFCSRSSWSSSRNSFVHRGTRSAGLVPGDERRWGLVVLLLLLRAAEKASESRGGRGRRLRRRRRVDADSRRRRRHAVAGSLHRFLSLSLSLSLFTADTKTTSSRRRWWWIRACFLWEREESRRAVREIKSKAKNI